jgi:threonine synthase
MDVGDPSNFERLRSLYPERAAMPACIVAVSIDDPATRARIGAEDRHSGRVLCPHTAVAAEAWHRLSADERRRLHWVIVATAHPAKFPEVVEPLLGRPLKPPPALARLLERPLRRTEIAADLGALGRRLDT